MNNGNRVNWFYSTTSHWYCDIISCVSVSFPIKKTKPTVKRLKLLIELTILGIIIGIFLWMKSDSLEGGSGLVFTIPISLCIVFIMYGLIQLILKVIN